MSKSSVVRVKIEAELPSIELTKEVKDCEQCTSRFKCWTHRGMAIQVEKFTLSNDGTTPEKLRFMLHVPRCFRCTNLVGTEALIHMKIDGLEQDIKSLIMEQRLVANKPNAPMELEIESIREFI